MKVRIHFNRHPKREGYIWTVHTSRECIPAKKVTLKGSTSTEYKPEKASNPRAFMVADASEIQRLQTGEVVIAC